MTDEPDPILPAFRIPLSPDQLTLLGVFCAIWSQIDYFAGLTIAGLLKTPIGAAETFMENMTTGPRINMLRRLSARIEDEEHKKLAKTFCTDMSPLIEDRNHLLHGMWGWHTAKDPKDMFAASHYAKRDGKPIAASKLLVLCNRASTQTHVIVKIQRHVYNLDHLKPDPTGEQPSFFFGADGPPGWQK
jgi:hypothetical protein